MNTLRVLELMEKVSFVCDRYPGKVHIMSTPRTDNIKCLDVVDSFSY